MNELFATPLPSRAAIRRSRRVGLTLIEAMLTMVILGIAGVVLVTAASQCLAVVRAGHLYSQAHALLQRVELENPLFLEEIQPGTEEGRFPDPDLSRFAWRRDIEVVGEETEGLFEVRTRILWSDRGRKGFEEIIYYRFAPEEDS